ncbi:CRP-like cAMP-binding protein [Hydrogenophaga palleronii]|uniref:CRP-like cAMP-binding protein n=1 Tax=Hydrogenophaga palleronii TaxID=65655 RepID=A0ABU1WR12_9BURK|nr:Crp/Fnr family transcriptional regulator [Hydrogenophaga palleronii]MDR7151737.1 CRP-like cAMP-binding protein [Hydrogenophaga palleronii]
MDPTHPTLHDVFQRLAGCALPEWPQLEAATTERRLTRGEPLFTAGEDLPCVFAVSEGIVKMVYETPKGDAWVKGFAEAGVCFASLSALEDQGRTSFSAYAEVPSWVHQVRYAVLRELADRHLPWQRAVANAMRIYGQRKEKRELELLTLSPPERYQRFLQEHPALVNVLRQRDVASYIRVTPVALSRIKARLLRGAADAVRS